MDFAIKHVEVILLGSSYSFVDEKDAFFDSFGNSEGVIRFIVLRGC